MPYESEIRAQKKTQTRKALVDAAIDMFVEHGLDEPSINSICREAGCTRGAFHFHFKSREELTMAAMDQALGAFIGEIMTEADDAAGFVDAFLTAIVSRRPEAGGSVHLQFRHALVACAKYPALRARYTATLDAASATICARLQAQGVPDARGRALMVRLMALGLLATVDLEQEVDVELIRAMTRDLVQP